MDLQAAEVHLLDYWPALLRRRWIIAVAVVLCAVGALLVSVATTPSFRASATVQIERHGADVLTFQDLSRVDHSWAAYNDFYQTQYKIIASRGVARAAVTRGGLTAHPAFDVDGDGARPSGLRARLGRLLRGAPAEDESPDPIEVAVETVLGGLEVVPVRDSHLVEIAWVSDDPELAARVANAVADAYVFFNMNSQFGASEDASGFLMDQIATLKRDIQAAEADLQQYGEREGIVSIDDTNNITLQSLKDISTRLTVAEAALARERAAWLAVRDARPDALPEVRNSALIARLREEFARFEADYAELSGRFKPGWPSVQTAASRLEQTRERLLVESERIAGQVRAATQAAYESSKAEVEGLRALLRTREDAAQELKRDAVEYANLQSEVRKKRETLNVLMTRQNEMALSTRLRDLGEQSYNIRVMEPARVPSTPFTPRTSRNVILGLLLGLGLGVVLALLLDFVDNTIGSVDEMTRLVELPVLAVIPRHGSPPRRRTTPEAAETVDLIAHREPRASASEAYRELRTSIMLSSAGRQPKQLMVTSALPEDGKTSTAINLAVVLAQLGRRVLLIDTDLRRPRLHKTFGASNRRGVSTYLSGQHDRASTLAVSTPVEGLDLLPSGPVPPNPSELLDSEVFGAMSRELLDAGYDHLVYDSPPTLSVSDAVILAQLADVAVLVARAHRTPRQSIRHAAEKLTRAAGGTLGIVLNDLDPERLGKAHYHYYGRYGEPDELETPPRARRAGGSGS